MFLRFRVGTDIKREGGMVNLILLVLMVELIIIWKNGSGRGGGIHTKVGSDDDSRFSAMRSE